MKSAIAIGSLLATSVLAKPLVHKHHQRDWDFVEETDTVYTTVTAGGSGWSWGSWGGGSSDSSGSWGDWSGSASSPAAAVPVVTETALAGSPPAAAPAPAQASPTDSWGSSPSGSSAPAPSSASGSQGSGPGGIDIASILDQHNNHRANHSAPALTWDDNLASIAATIASSCVYAHNTQAGGGGYGQNIGAGTAAADVPAMITNEMYNDEFGWYPTPWGQDNPDMTNFEHWGHLSQIVWKSTTSVGCAWQDCSGQGLANAGSGVSPWFVVCNYSPPGNFGGEYSNVGAPGSAPVVTL